MHIDIWTDGGCEPNPGFGGWAAILICNGVTVSISGHDPDTTNNRMEMMAAIRALEDAAHATTITLHSDSAYLVHGITKWVAGWKAKGWKRGKDPVANVDLWKRLDELNAARKVRWRHVRGHSGIHWNEQADALATRARLQGMQKEAVTC